MLAQGYVFSNCPTNPEFTTRSAEWFGLKILKDAIDYLQGDL